jgi:hypothetical protein
MSDPTAPSPYAGDLLERQAFCQNLERFLLTEHDFVEGSLIVSLHAPFGFGKSTTVRMWLDDLRNRRATDPSLPRSVLINAWESDYCGDPLVAIISAITTALADATDPEPKQEEAKAIREGLKDVGWMALGLANGFIGSQLGVDVVAAGELAERKRAERAGEPPTNILEGFEAKQHALGALKSNLRKAFEGENVRALVVIDELDRCRPDYAIHYLETIKHIFDIHGIAFVLAVDELQLGSAATVLFGQRLVASEYFRKFFHRSISLPKANERAVGTFTVDLAKRFFVKAGKRACGYTADARLIRELSRLLLGYQLSLRQAHEAFRIMGHAYAKSEANHENMAWSYGGGIAAMSVLKIIKSDDYHRLGRGELPISELWDLLEPLTRGPKDKREWWFKLLLCGYVLDAEWRRQVEAELSKRKLYQPNSNDPMAFNRAIGEFAHSWEMCGFGDKAGLAHAYEHIEAVASFAS